MLQRTDSQSSIKIGISISINGCDGDERAADDLVLNKSHGFHYIDSRKSSFIVVVVVGAFSSNDLSDYCAPVCSKCYAMLCYILLLANNTASTTPTANKKNADNSWAWFAQLLPHDYATRSHALSPSVGRTGRMGPVGVAGVCRACDLSPVCRNHLPFFQCRRFGASFILISY